MRILAIEAYALAKEGHEFEVLTHALDMKKAWGFLFELEGEIIIGGEYIVIKKNGKGMYKLPIIPANLKKLDKSTKLPISMFVE
jgi:hypothetical protein